jgi:hypothetical protein
MDLKMHHVQGSIGGVAMYVTDEIAGERSVAEKHGLFPPFRFVNMSIYLLNRSGMQSERSG